MSEIKIYYDPGGAEPGPENEGLYPEGASGLMTKLGEAGVAYSAIDVSGLARHEREDLYTRLAVTPSVRRRYRVKRIFGTNKYPGSRFGKGVPALVVLEDGRPQDVYPHEEEGGKVVTIKEYVDRVARNGKRGRELVRRMNALRAKIGRVGVSARELIDEGRRR